MNPCIRDLLPQVFALRELSVDDPGYKRRRNELYAQADARLCVAISRSKPGSELYGLRKTIHPRLKMEMCILALMFFLMIIFIRIAPGELSESEAASLVLILCGAVLLVLLALLWVILREKRPRAAYLERCFDAANRILDSLPADRLDRAAHFFTYANELPGVVCGCVDRLRLFRLPETFDVAEEEAECPTCHGDRLAYDSPEYPLTDDILAELHDLIYKE